MRASRVKRGKRRLPRFLPELCRRLAARGAQRIYLFGSWARGEADEDSDVDLVVIQETSLPFFDRLREAARELEPEWNVDILVYNPEEFQRMIERGNALAETVIEEGTLLYG
jgi:predicted nucleotidyltransferase